jgi:transcription elongation factor Elf1
MSGVAGLIASTIFSEGDDPRIGDIGTINVGYNDPRSLLGMTFNEVSKLAEANDDRIVQVSHFNSDGIAVDKNNRVVSTLSGPNVVQTSSVMVNSVKGWHLAATLSPEELQTRADITAARDKDDIFSTPFMDSYDEVGGWLGDADDDEEDKEVDVDDEEAANFTDFMSQEQAGDDADSGAAGDQEGGGFAEGPGGYSGYW